MTSRIRRSAQFALCAALLPTLSNAAEEQGGQWSGKAAMGYLATSGNTENSNVNTSFAIAYAAGQWKHTFEAFAVHATEDEATTAEAYDLGWKSERDLTEHGFLFGGITWRKDRFSGYDTQLSESVGYGRHLIDKARHRLNAEVGIGARQSDRTDGIEEEEVIVRGGLSYQWLLSETAEFSQGFVVESGAENTYMESVSALKAGLIGDLALVASFTVKNNSSVPVGTEKTDTYSALSLEYGF